MPAEMSRMGLSEGFDSVYAGNGGTTSYCSGMGGKQIYREAMA